MTGPSRDTGDRDRLNRPPEWFLRQLAERAAELFDDVNRNHQTPEWQEKLDRWREIWDGIRDD